MGKGQNQRGIGLKKSVAVTVGVAIIAGLGAPYWMGRQIERQYTGYLQQWENFDYIRVENLTYTRDWFQAQASYELTLEPEFAQAYQRFLTSQTALEFEGEPLRIVVNDWISHGPFMGALASLEGRAEASGWLFEQLVKWEEGAALSHYDARVGFDRVVRGEWAPMEMALVAGPLLTDAGLDMRYAAEYLGGDFRFDLGSGEYRSTGRLGQARLEEPTAIHTFEGSTSSVVAAFPQGVLREITFRSDDAPMLTESRDFDQASDSRIEGQSVDIKLLFDEQGRFEHVTTHFEMQGFESEAPNLYLAMAGLDADFAASRQGESSWYGQLDLALDGVSLREQGLPGLTAQSVSYGLGVEPESETQFQLTQLAATRDLRIQGMDEPIAFHFESSYGQLPRTEYDTLWSLIYDAIDRFQLDDPEAVLPVFERMENAGEALVAGRSAFTLKPVTFSIGDADAAMTLEADLDLESFSALDQHRLLAPENRLDLNVNASALLLHKVARESLRQQYGGMISGNELEAMAKETVAEGLQPMLDLGVVRREDGDRYSLNLRLQDGRLLMNGEPGEWLLGQF
ncbi:MAG: YdgA family protein [Halomonas sp.]|nr:YdgA family protein [Halomonas sp.]MDX5502944.1 YdgA family protein [Halomonas sp.]